MFRIAGRANKMTIITLDCKNKVNQMYKLHKANHHYHEIVSLCIPERQEYLTV
jgi:hypothetical protein